MNVWIGILTAVEVIVAILLIVIVLIQPSKAGGGLGSVGGGVAEQVFGATAGNVLTKATVWLSGIFMVLALALVVLGAHRQAKSGKSMVESDLAKSTATVPAKKKGPANTAAPVTVTTTTATAVKAEAEAVQEAVKPPPPPAPVVPAVPATPAKPAEPVKAP